MSDARFRKALAYLDGQIATCERQLVDGTCGGATDTDRQTHYLAKVELRRTLIRVRDELAAAINQDNED